VERYAALLDRQLQGRGKSATDALEEALGHRRLVAAGQVVAEFASALCVKGEWRERAVPAPFPSEGLPPMP
jgi:sorbitol-specific phosphotransferase system component IIA